MSGHRASHYLLLLISLNCLSCTVWEKPPRAWAGATGGEQLERQLWKEIEAQNWSELQKHLAPTFRTSLPPGALDAAGAMDYWKSLELQDYLLSDFEVRPNGADIVVTYSMIRRGTREGRPLSQEPLRLMSVWQEVSKGWILIAHSVAPAASAPAVSNQ